MHLADLAGVLLVARKKRLGDVRLFDLILAADLPLASCHGIYCFYSCDPVTCLYVGKVESPQFIERLPSHLSLSDGSWFNQFMRGIRSECASFEKAALIARECTLLLIPMPQEFVALAELVLIERLNPKFNKRRPKSGFASVAHDHAPFGKILSAIDAAEEEPN